MAKTKVTYVCRACGSTQNKWMGQCPDCGEWNSFTQETAVSASPSPPKGLGAGKGRVIPLLALDQAGGALHAQTQKSRLRSGISEFDRVCGGGLVAGSVLLIGGDPGIGKSTLLLQVVAHLAARQIETIYISGEESTDQVQMRAERLGLGHAPARLASATNLRDIIATIEAEAPACVVIDSIQTMFVDTIESAPGTVSQVRACAAELIRVAKTRNIVLFLVGHVTKEGQLAGPRVLEHMVDTVLYFEGDRGHAYRILRTVKNRFGATDEIGVFEMAERGLQEVANPSALFLGDQGQPVSGSVVFAGIEGSRPLLVEIQALVAPTSYGTPRRAVVGWDLNRLNMILAVLEARAGLPFGQRDVYLNVAGGLRITEPAADLAVAAALISALRDRPLPRGSVAFGEIALSGAIRPVSQSAVRLKEAAKLGFEAALCAAAKMGAVDAETTLALERRSTIRDVVSGI